MSEAKVVIRAKDETAKAFNAVSGRVGKLGSMFTSTQAKIAGLVGAGGLGAFVTMSAKAKLATKAFTDAMNASSQELQAWDYALEGSGVGAEKLADIWRDSSEKIGEAFSSGGGEAADVIERLNLSAGELARLSPDQKLLAVGDAMKEIKSNDERIYLMESLASDSSQLLPYITENTEQFKALTDEAKRSGAAISDIESEKLQAASVSMSRSLQILQGGGARVAAAVAPYVEAISSLFAEAAAEHDGFKTEIINGTEAMVNAVAFLGDMYRGLEAVWVGLKVAFFHNWHFMLDGLGTLGKAIEEVLNTLPWVNSNGSAYFDGLADSARESMDESIEQLDRLVSTPMPSQKVEEFFDEVRKKAEETATAAVASRNAAAMTAVPGQSFGDKEEEDKRAEEMEELRQRLSERYDTVAESLLSEQEQLRLSYETKEFIVEDAFQQSLINDQERKSTLEMLEEQHMQRLEDIQSKHLSNEERMWQTSWEGKAQVVSGVLGSLSQLMITENKRAFEVGKRAAIAQAIVDTITSAQAAFKSLAGIPYVGPALGAAAAGAAIAAGYARVDSIRNTSFDSGGGGGRSTGSAGSVSVGGGQPPEAVPAAAYSTQPQGSGGTTTINLVGEDNSSLSYNQVDQMFGALTEALDRGDKVLFSRNSRQAQELSA